MSLSRANFFILAVAAAYLLPLVIPNVGLDYQYFFITVIVLFAWFLFKWNRVKAITQKSGKVEILLGSSLIVADYAFNAMRGSNVGILDLLIIFLGAVIVFYGIRSLRIFWVPLTYGVILLAGYQIEYYTPNFTVLQDWLAGLMASTLSAMGISSVAFGHIVSMTMQDGTPLALDVDSACTGVQGILAFGMLSTMALLDLKPRMSRLIPIFAVGFAGAFLVNIVRLLAVFLTFEFAGVDAGTAMHVYFGYTIFIAWVLVFWSLAFKYLVPKQAAVGAHVTKSPRPGSQPP
ncbi:MAG: archaeosortase/exosortase family protein [Nitrososphaerales archaeon]